MQQDIINIDIKLPTKWEDLTDKQLRYVFALLSQGFTATEVKAYCLWRWAGLKILHRYGNNDWACRHGKQEFILPAEQVERATHALGWLDKPSPVPVRLERIGRPFASAVHSPYLRERHRQRIHRTQQQATHTPCQDNLHGYAPQD